ncbi:MAG: hypothetical protein MJ000_08460 [Bacteroidales bacterium]|nr:hypothetical protein [Bacteroidales bacterium]
MEITQYLLDNPNSSFDILKHLVNALPSNQLIEIRDNTTNEYLWLYTNNLINPKPDKDTVKHINAPLQKLLNEFTNSRGKHLQTTRRELQKRFDGQSFSDQELIIDAFMKKGTKTDVVWCSKYFIEYYADTVIYQDQAFDVVGQLFWKDKYLDIVKRYWEADIENYKLLKVILQFDSIEYMKDKINELESYSDGVIDDVAYPQLLIKVCEDKNYTLPKGRLTPFQIAYISAKTDRSITEEEASATLRWVINNELNWHFYFVRNLQGHIVFRDYKYSSIGLTLWSLSKLGHTSVIIAFNEWIKSATIQLESLEHIDNNTINNICIELTSKLYL